MWCNFLLTLWTHIVHCCAEVCGAQRQNMQCIVRSPNLSICMAELKIWGKSFISTFKVKLRRIHVFSNILFHTVEGNILYGLAVILLSTLATMNSSIPVPQPTVFSTKSRPTRSHAPLLVDCAFTAQPSNDPNGRRCKTDRHSGGGAFK